MLDESGEIDREYNDITLGDFLLYQYEFYKPSNITEVYHTSIDTYHDDGAIMDHVDLRERDLEDVSLEDIDETIIDNFFNCSNIYDEEDKGDVSIFKYNKENPLPHTIKISKWKDEDIYELSSMELLDDASTDPETGATIQNDLKYTVTMYGNEYMMETYGYSEGTTNYITTNIFDCADDNRLIYRLNQETHLSLFETKIITTYDLDGLKFRIQNITETDISGTNLKAYKYIYESPELVIEIDHSKNTITSFSSPVYNIADSYVYVRNIWGTLEKLDISRFERIFK